MKLIQPSFEIWEQNTNTKLASAKHVADNILIHGLYQQIEKAGRTCYKSEDKITYDSCIPFVQRLIDSKHYAMLEHGTVYLKVPYYKDKRAYPDDYLPNCVGEYSKNPYSKVYTFWKDDEAFDLITTNYRVIIENGWESDMQYFCPPTEFHEKRITVHFTCNRQVSHEFVRHRVFSFAMESTRFCNYSNGKFGKELTFIKPCWNYDNILPYFFETVEANYFALIAQGWKPQQAATVLPNAIKTELIMTGFIDDWKHFFDLRALGTTGAPHPQAKELAEPLMNKFKELNLI